MRRKRNQLILTLVITGLIFYFLQSALINPFLSIGPNFPDLLLILTVFVGIRLGQMGGSVFGFSAGLLQDVLIDFYGLNALCKTVIGFIARYFRADKVLLVEKYYFPISVFFSALIQGFLFYGFMALDSSLNFYSLYTQHAVPNAVYSAVAAFTLRLAIPDRFLNFVHYDIQYEY